MMTAEQRYRFDLHGYLHVRNALSAEELAAARKAAERYVDTPPEKLPEGFGVDGKRFLHGFAFDAALERLAMHPSIWPIVKELTRGRPRLASGTLQVNAASEDTSQAMRLHCARDDFGWDAIRYEVRDGRIFCDHTVVFPLSHRRPPRRRRSAGGARLPQVDVRAAVGAVQPRRDRDPRRAPGRRPEHHPASRRHGGHERAGHPRGAAVDAARPHAHDPGPPLRAAVHAQRRPARGDPGGGSPRTRWSSPAMPATRT